MRMVNYFLFSLLCSISLSSQSLYFPPIDGSEWATTDPSELSWCPEKIDSLYHFLEENNTKSFILLKEGKIVLEQYFNGHGVDSLWYWASAGKTVTATLTGIAQKEGFLDIGDSTSDYLGNGWTNAPADKESLITIWHQLTMTSGLDDGVADNFCTDADCLLYLQDAGSRWAYHNGPYTNLSNVIEEATGLNYNLYYYNQLANKIGMGGGWIYAGYNRLLLSDSRSMARFGLLVQNSGFWENTPILDDADFMDQMVNTSQDLNLSYGYLWWLNGKDTYRLPQTQIEFTGSLMPDAPADLYAAMGKNGQYINVVPSEGIVLIRMGEAPDDSLVPANFNNDIWKYINDLSCIVNETSSVSKYELEVFPNPVFDEVTFDIPYTENTFSITIYNALGGIVKQAQNKRTISLNTLSAGLYFYTIDTAEKVYTGSFYKN